MLVMLAIMHPKLLEDHSEASNEAGVYISVSGLPKATLMFDNSLRELTGLSILPDSQLRFITAQGYKAKPAKGKGT